jgi:hypothetical protein
MIIEVDAEQPHVAISLILAHSCVLLAAMAAVLAGRQGRPGTDFRADPLACSPGGRLNVPPQG